MVHVSKLVRSVHLANLKLFLNNRKQNSDDLEVRHQNSPSDIDVYYELVKIIRRRVQKSERSPKFSIPATRLC